MKTETPRTDAAWDESNPLQKLSEKERREFAGKLELELRNDQHLIERLKSDLNEATTQLRAWQKSFGTSQLTHALARLEAAEKRAAAMPNEKLTYRRPGRVSRVADQPAVTAVRSGVLLDVISWRVRPKFRLHGRDVQAR
jgi:hypothetical protein